MAAAFNMEPGQSSDRVFSVGVVLNIAIS